MSLVLIVDEQPGVRQLLAGWISREGQLTTEAADAEAALEEMMRRPADVVLCDVRAPRQDGFWLAARLRERFPETALILVTDSSDVPPLIQLPEGVVAYLVMPFGREGVLRAVRLGLAWHQMSRAIRAKKDDNSFEAWLATDPEPQQLHPRSGQNIHGNDSSAHPRIDARELAPRVGPDGVGHPKPPAEQVCTSYSHRKGDYLYDVRIYEIPAPKNAVRFSAHVVNLVRLASGHTAAVHAELPDQHGATLDEAFSHIDAAVAAWVKDQSQSD